MTYYSPRHSTTDRDAIRAARQASENARDTAEALGRKLSAHVTGLSRYTATGKTETRLQLEASRVRPHAVVLIHVAPSDDLSAAVTVTPSLGFSWNSSGGTVEVNEPGGLVAGKAYRLAYLVVED